MLAESNEEVCYDARRHGVVLARPLAQAVVLAGSGGILLTQPWPLPLPGAALVALAALVCLRAVWCWERAHLVVTTEKLFVVDGTLRRRSSAVRLRSVENLELEQSLTGRLLGYGTLVAGPLEIEHVPQPRSVYRLVERLAG
ncbi:MAG: PH domain-containing protein [Actinomycetota bacterium]|nr:PH domain-containing protein [Actinomycetota bacterium]